MAPTPRLPAVEEISEILPSLDPSVGPVDAFCLLVLYPHQVQKTMLTLYSFIDFPQVAHTCIKKFE